MVPAQLIWEQGSGGRESAQAWVPVEHLSGAVGGGSPYRAEAGPVCLLLAQVGTSQAISPLYLPHGTFFPPSWLT